MPKSTKPFRIITIKTPGGWTERVYADRPRNLSELLDNAVKKYGHQEAIIDANTRLSYKQFDSLIGNMASALYYNYGIKKGDRIALMLRNGWEFVTSFFAIARTGAIMVPLNTALKGEELAFQVKDSGATLLIVEPEFQALMAEAISGAEGMKQIFIAGGEPAAGTVAFSELLKQEEQPPVAVEVDEEDIAALMYTSGTTGRPKGALLTPKGIMASGMNSVQLCDMRNGRDKMLVVAPLFHITGLAMTFTSSIYAGIPVVMVKRFKAADTLKIIQEEKVTIIFGVPTIYWLMLNAPEFDQYDLSSLRYLASGGADTPEDVVRCCAEKLPGVQLAPGYGLTEACGMSYSTTSIEEALSKPRSSGRPLPTIDAKIVDSSGRELPPGEPGELLIRSCQVMKGYWNNPKVTRETIVDGWLHTGDIAKIMEDGHLYICDRVKDMIIRGGENIYSIEVENVLYRNPKVLEAAVVGVPDPVFGEQVKAAIVLRPGEQSTEEEIQEFCRKHLANYKVPKYVEFREALPRNPAGKVIKDSLK